MTTSEMINRAADVVSNAGGQIVGRTRLQKVTYLLKLAGYVSDFNFEYKHYGPYSEDLARSIELANVFDLVEEDERPTEKGGFYSIYRCAPRNTNEDQTAREFSSRAARSGAIALELAATAAYLKAEEGVEDPWDEVANRKPEKASAQNLQAARLLYQELAALPTRTRLPKIV